MRFPMYAGQGLTEEPFAGAVAEVNKADGLTRAMVNGRNCLVLQGTKLEIGQVVTVEQDYLGNYWAVA